MENITQQYKALRARRGELLTESEQILALGASQDGGLTDEQKARDDAIHTEMSALDTDIARYKRTLEADRTAEVDPETQKVVRNANGDPMCGYKDLGEFAVDVHRACRPGHGVMSEKLTKMYAAPTNYLQEAGGSSGEGYLVPPQMRASLFELVFDGTGMLGMVDIEPTNSNAVELLADESTPWGATGIQAKWKAEDTQMTATKPDTDNRLTRVHDLYAFVLATDNLLNDGPRLNDRLTRKSSQAIRYKAGEAIVNGTGAGQPLGWKHATYNGGVEIAKESGQAADTFNANNAAKMFAQQLNLSDSRWVCNQDVLPQLFTMTLGDNSVFVPPATGFQQAPGGFLLGRPVVPLEHMETIGDAGDIANISPSGYHAVGKGGGIQFASSVHLYFDYGIEAFRWTFRIGGQPFLKAAVSPAKGSNSRSHFVTLAARA